MCLRFKFCTHQRVFVLNFFLKVKFVVHQCAYRLIHRVGALNWRQCRWTHPGVNFKWRYRMHWPRPSSMCKVQDIHIILQNEKAFHVEEPYQIWAYFREFAAVSEPFHGLWRGSFLVKVYLQKLKRMNSTMYIHTCIVSCFYIYAYYMYRISVCD